jgi:hypothetical protein
MKWLALITAMCCVLPGEGPPLFVSVSVNTAEYEAGDLVYLTAVIYSTSATPARLAVRFDAAPGLVLIETKRNGTGSVWQDHPDMLQMVYRVSEDAPDKGTLLKLTVTAQADGEWAQDSVTIRNGTYPQSRLIYLPLVQ